MKFYEVETDEGPRLVGTQLDAKKFTKHARTVEIPTDKEGLMKYVNELRAFAVAEGELNVEATIAKEPATAKTGYTEWSVGLDEAFDKLPLAHKLDFAAKAMEAAREAIP